MFNILDRIEKEQIIIKRDFDNICEKCPNLVNNICTIDEEINLLDDKVLKILNIELNKPVYFNELKLKLAKNLTEDKFSYICRSCSWYKKGFCKFENFNINIKK